MTTRHFSFFKKHQRAEVLNLPSNLEVAKHLFEYTVFRRKKLTCKLRPWQKIVFLFKSMSLASGPLLLPRICQLKGTWEALHPLAPIITSNATRFSVETELKEKSSIKDH